MENNPLIQQAEKIEKHARQGSINTRRDYKKSFRVFVKWLWENYKVQHIKNISNKHLEAFVEYQLAKGNKATYITKILSAIRYYHDQVPRARHELTCGNSSLGVPKREKPGDRAWTCEEYERMKQEARDLNKLIFVSLFVLIWELGLRIHEAVRLYRVDIERALANGALRVKGKTGKERDVPLTPVAETELLKLKKDTPRGAKVFVKPGEKADQVIKDIQDFIRKHREPREGEKLTAHGLRYNYAQRELQETKDQGETKEKAERTVSEKLGHKRRDIARGYASWD